MEFKIRKRPRRLASPPEGLKQSWTEWQIVKGRKILARCDSEREAQDWLRKNRDAEIR